MAESPAEQRPTDETSAARTKRGAGEKRERILAAAVRVFAKKGFYAARVSEIARAAGVADGTIYLYFKNKDELLTTIFEQGIRKLIARMREALDAHETAADRIRRMVEIQLGVLGESRELAQVITVNLRQSSELLEHYGQPLFLEYLHVLARVVKEGQASGELRADVSPQTAARALFGALDGIALSWAYGSAEPEVLRKASGQVAALFLSGLERR